MSLRATLMFLVAIDAFGQAPQAAPPAPTKSARRKLQKARNRRFGMLKAALVSLPSIPRSLTGPFPLARRHRVIPSSDSICAFSIPSRSIGERKSTGDWRTSASSRSAIPTSGWRHFSWD